MKRFIPLIIISMLFLITAAMFVFTGNPEVCEPPPEELAVPDKPWEKPAIPEPDPEPEPEPEPEWDGPVNPLTGLPVETEIHMYRPLAIVINNLRVAQPQLGIGMADIIYEAPAEGGVTRMVAVFQDVSDVGVIGTVRSARPYHVDIAQAHDAIFIFAGGSPEAYRILSNRNITRLDGVHGRQTQIFYRDQQRRRNMGFEHSLVTSGELITQWLPTYNFRLELDDNFEHTKQFVDDGTPPGGTPAEEFTVRFPGAKSTSFSYSDGRYYVSQFGGPYRDGNDGTQLAVTNVLILRTAVSRIPGDAEGRLRVTLVGSGSGYFFSGGEYVEIEWSRENETAPFAYTHLDGTPLVFGRGSTYVCVVATDSEVTIN